MMPQLQKTKSNQKLPNSPRSAAAFSPTCTVKSIGGSSSRRSVKSAQHKTSKVPPQSYLSTSRVTSQRRQPRANQKTSNELLHSDSFIETVNTNHMKSEGQDDFHQISYIQTNTTQAEYRSAATLKNGGGNSSPMSKSLKRPASSKGMLSDNLAAQVSELKTQNANLSQQLRAQADKQASLEKLVQKLSSENAQVRS